jgi:ribosome modulation factor
VQGISSDGCPCSSQVTVPQSLQSWRSCKQDKANK